MRADRLGCYGYERDTTPALDRFAQRRAQRFVNAVAESSWTLPSHVSLFSGLHPLEHGVRLPEHKPGPDVELLAERLAAEGYYNFGITDEGWLTEGWGFDRGFHSFHAKEKPFARAVREATEYIRFRDQKGPWFGFVHTYDVHCPYDPPEPFFSMFQSPAAVELEVEGRCGNPDFNAAGLDAGQARYLSDRYDGSVRAVDEVLAQLFEFLDAEEIWKDTVVVITSDHGEEFGEHGQIGHERTLSIESLRIPLLVAAPQLGPGVVSAPTGLADAHGLVLDLLGLETAPPRREFVVSDLAWQVELSSRYSVGEHVVQETGAIEDPELRALREELSAEARQPGTYVGDFAGLGRLGYGD